MELYPIDAPLTNYLFMGCWNKDGCRSAGQASVARALQKEPLDWPLFLGGDNIYPDKVDGKKVYTPRRIEEGIACLNRQGSKMFATLGNHNIATPEILEAELAAPWILHKHSYGILFSNEAVLFLNSNSLDNGTEGERREMLETLGTTLAYLKTRRISYTIVMHHPIISLKKKSYYVLPYHAELLNVLRDYPPIRLLVADTHNYQKGIVSWKGMDVEQIVVGTGGADLDPIPTPTPTPSFEGSYTVEDVAVSFGYLRVVGGVAEFVSPRSPRSPTSHTTKTRRQNRRNHA